MKRPSLFLVTFLSLKSTLSNINIVTALLTVPKPLTVDHNKLWEILKEVGIPDHLTCLLRNLYAGQEATVRTGHGTTDWFQIGKGAGSFAGPGQSDGREESQAFRPPCCIR